MEPVGAAEAERWVWVRVRGAVERTRLSLALPSIAFCHPTTNRAIAHRRCSGSGGIVLRLASCDGGTVGPRPAVWRPPARPPPSQLAFPAGPLEQGPASLGRSLGGARGSTRTPLAFSLVEKLKSESI